MTKPLIVFYSLDGFTQKIAQEIARQTQGDLLQLYPKQDLPSTKSKRMKYMRGGKQVMMKETPKLQTYTCDITQYDTIYIGTPVRAFTYTPAIRSFLQTTPIHDKKIILFCTHEGGPGETINKLKKELTNNTIFATKEFNKRVLEHDENLLKKEIQTIITTE